MDTLTLQRSVRTAKLGRAALFAACMVLLVSNVLLVLKLYTSSNQVVLVPTSVSDGMVARGVYDKQYVEALAKDAVFGLYNVSPNNTDYGRQVIERLSAVGNRARLLDHYDRVAQDIKDRNISTVFYPHRIEHNHQALEVVVIGDLETLINTVAVNREARRILLGFKLEAGSVRLNAVSILEDEA